MPTGLPVEYRVMIDGQKAHQMDREEPTGNTPSELHLLLEDGSPLCLRNWATVQIGFGQFQSERPAEPKETEP
jgi:hypothetical protein